MHSAAGSESRSPVVEGATTEVVCSTCGEQTVLMVYRRYAQSVMFCQSCEAVWEEHAGDSAD